MDTTRCTTSGSSSSMSLAAKIEEAKLSGIASTTLITSSSTKSNFTVMRRLVRPSLLVRVNPRRQMMTIRKIRMLRTLSVSLQCVSVPTIMNMFLNQFKTGSPIRLFVLTRQKWCKGISSAKVFTPNLNMNSKRSNKIAKISIRSFMVITMVQRLKTCQL